MKRVAIYLAQSLGLLVWLALLSTGRCEEAGAVRAGVSNPLFALCFDLQDAKKRTLDEQAEMLAELGYDGAAHTWLAQVPERLKALDANGLRLFQVYVRVSVDPAKPKYDPRLPEIVKLLAGRKTILGLLIQGGKSSDPADDDRAVAVVREIADMAAASGVRVAIYPHAGDFAEKTSDAVRLVKKVDRTNAGVMFNLCHWLKVEGPKNLESVLEEAAPHLLAVTINGADPPPGNWDRLIQPLGKWLVRRSARARVASRAGLHRSDWAAVLRHPGRRSGTFETINCCLERTLGQDPPSE